MFPGEEGARPSFIREDTLSKLRFFSRAWSAQCACVAVLPAMASKVLAGLDQACRLIWASLASREVASEIVKDLEEQIKANFLIVGERRSVGL